jgi:YidC/Oxa1 family membrane protein insertase
MEKRLIIAIILSVIILVTYQLLFLKPSPSTQTKPAETKTGKSASPGAAVKKEAPTPEAKDGESPKRETSPPPPASLSEIPATQAVRIDTVVETDLYKAVLDNQGGIIKRFVLKRYQDNHKGGVDLVPTIIPTELGSFLSVSTPGNSELEKEINQLVFEVGKTTVQGAQGRGTQIQFVHQRSDLRAVKTITFWTDQPYQVSVDCSIHAQGRRLEKAYLRLGPGLTDHDLVPAQYVISPQIVTFNGSSTDILEGKNINDSNSGRKKLQGSWSWAGIETKFFAALAIPRGGFSELIAQNDVWTAPNPDKKAEEPVKTSLVSLWMPVQPGNPVDLYMGPKSYETLSAIREDLAKTIDYGWFAIIVKPLYYALRWVNKYLVNWGVSIIVLTFFITLAMFPIRYMQMKNMKDMQKIQPQMKVIQNKYKNLKSAEDRQRMNQEMSGLWKEAGVNPAAGCLPMVAQIPFLIAFYNLIDKSIELWRQPFMLWLRDLSAPDPYYVTPVLMGLTMILQMKQTPPTPGQDSRMQKQMMYIMPVVLTIFFLNMSSGLVVYFLFSNVFSWGMQKVYELIVPATAAAAPASKKDKKKKAL